MRVYLFVFVAFDAIRIRGTTSSEISTSTLSQPDDLASYDNHEGVPVARVLRAQRVANDEERAPLSPKTYMLSAGTRFINLLIKDDPHMVQLPLKARSLQKAYYKENMKDYIESLPPTVASKLRFKDAWKHKERRREIIVDAQYEKSKNVKTLILQEIERMIKAYIHPNEVFKMIVQTDGASGELVDRFDEILASPGLVRLTTYIEGSSKYMGVTLLSVFLNHYGDIELARLLATSNIAFDRRDMKLMQRVLFTKFARQSKTIREVADMLKVLPGDGVSPGFTISWQRYIAILAIERPQKQTAIVADLMEMYPGGRYLMLIRRIEEEYSDASDQLQQKVFEIWKAEGVTCTTIYDRAKDVSPRNELTAKSIASDFIAFYNK